MNQTKTASSKSSSEPSYLSLAIDPGATSGVALLHGAERLASWTVKLNDFRTREEIVDIAHNEARARGLNLMVAIERWRGGGKWGTKSIAGTGAAFGVWKDTLLRAGYPASRIVIVYPTEWRGRVYGFAGGRDSKEWKRIAITYVEARFDLVLEADEAEAVCIALWMRGAEKVQRKAPKRRPKARSTT
jgi:hypothetical protein